MSNILITGAAGLIGSNLAEWIHLNHSEHNLFLLDDLSGGYIENIPTQLQPALYKLNAISPDVENIFKTNKIHIVYMTHAFAAEGLSPFIRCFNYDNNLVSNVKIVNLCIKYNITRLVAFSSMSVYGNNTTPFDETMIPCPIDPYGVAKYALEMDIRIAGEQHGLDYCIVRPHNVYSEHQNVWDKFRNVLAIWMYQSLHNQPITYSQALKSIALPKFAMLCSFKNALYSFIIKL